MALYINVFWLTDWSIACIVCLNKHIDGVTPNNSSMIFWYAYYNILVYVWRQLTRLRIRMATRLRNAAVAVVRILANLLTISSCETKRIDSRMTRYMMTPNTTASTHNTYTHTPTWWHQTQWPAHTTPTHTHTYTMTPNTNTTASTHNTYTHTHPHDDTKHKHNGQHTHTYTHTHTHTQHRPAATYIHEYHDTVAAL